jgi:hypothetical protein
MWASVSPWCRACVPAAELAHCVYHPAAAAFDKGCNDGAHACCGAPALRFDSTAGAPPLRLSPLDVQPKTLNPNS